MKVLFSNMPWWEEQHNGIWRAGVRAGSRWPFTNLIRSSPDEFVHGDYLPYPFFMGYAASYVDAHTDAQVYFRDSIALRESYETYAKVLHQIRPDYLFIDGMIYLTNPRGTGSLDVDRQSGGLTVDTPSWHRIGNPFLEKPEHITAYFNHALR